MFLFFLVGTALLVCVLRLKNYYYFVSSFVSNLYKNCKRHGIDISCAEKTSYASQGLVGRQEKGYENLQTRFKCYKITTKIMIFIHFYFICILFLEYFWMVHNLEIIAKLLSSLYDDWTIVSIIQ